jgi:hypothetical protein
MPDAAYTFVDGQDMDMVNRMVSVLSALAAEVAS